MLHRPAELKRWTALPVAHDGPCANFGLLVVERVLFSLVFFWNKTETVSARAGVVPARPAHVLQSRSSTPLLLRLTVTSKHAVTFLSGLVSAVSSGSCSGGMLLPVAGTRLFCVHQDQRFQLYHSQPLLHESPSVQSALRCAPGLCAWCPRATDGTSLLCSVGVLSQAPGRRSLVCRHWPMRARSPSGKVTRRSRVGEVVR